MRPLFFSIFALTLTACQPSPDELARHLAKDWCDCNRVLLPLYDSLEQQNSPGPKLQLLDSMQLKVAENVACLGGEQLLQELEQKLNRQNRELLIRQFEQQQAEQCPELLRLQERMQHTVPSH